MLSIVIAILVLIIIFVLFKDKIALKHESMQKSTNDCKVLMIAEKPDRNPFDHTHSLQKNIYNSLLQRNFLDMGWRFSKDSRVPEYDFNITNIPPADTSAADQFDWEIKKFEQGLLSTDCTSNELIPEVGKRINPQRVPFGKGGGANRLDQYLDQPEEQVNWTIQKRLVW